MATTNAKQWKNTRQVELALPSGNVCLAKRTGLDTFIKSGKVPNALLPMMTAAMAGDAVDVTKLEVTPALVDDMMTMMDLVLIDTVVEPKVLPYPEPGKARDEDALYPDDVDPEDKQFIFQWAVGGTADIEKFRTAQAERVASLQQS